MNEINIILEKYPSISKKDLFDLLDTVLWNYDNECPKSIDSLRNDIDKWCSVTIPSPYYLSYYPTLQEVAKSEFFFNLVHKTEVYRYNNNSLIIEGIRIIGTNIILKEYSQVIPEESDGPRIDYE